MFCLVPAPATAFSLPKQSENAVAEAGTRLAMFVFSVLFDEIKKKRKLLFKKL